MIPLAISAVAQDRAAAEEFYKTGNKFAYKYDQRSKDSALYYFNKSIAADNNFANAWYARSKMHDFKDPQKRIDDLSKAIAIEKKEVYYKERAENYWRLKDYAKARADYEQAYKLNSKNVSYLSDIGSTYLQIKDYKNALPWFEKAYSARQNYLSNHNLAETFYGLKDFRKAKPFADSAVATWPTVGGMFTLRDAEKPYMLRGQIQFALGNTEDAIADYTKYINSDMKLKDNDILYYRAQAYCKLGKKQEAMADMERYKGLKGSREFVCK